jgi:hypothetical protein
MQQRFKRAALKYRRYSPHAIRVIGRLSDAEFVWFTTTFGGTATILIRTSRCVPDTNGRIECRTWRNVDVHTDSGTGIESATGFDAVADSDSGSESVASRNSDADSHADPDADSHADPDADFGADRDGDAKRK